MVAELLVVLLELLVASALALEVLLEVAAKGFALAPVRACAAAVL
jgi:hypothetical protein